MIIKDAKLEPFYIKAQYKEFVLFDSRDDKKALMKAPNMGELLVDIVNRKVAEDETSITIDDFNAKINAMADELNLRVGSQPQK